MLDVVVVGAGYWGTGIALELRDRGLDVACLDSQEQGGASRAAGGLVYRGHLPRNLPSWWGPRHSEACLAFLERGTRDGWMQATGELFHTRRDPEPRFRAGLCLTDCARFLALASALPVRVTRLRSSHPGWQVEELRCRWLVLATGCFTDVLLAASGLPPTGVRALPGRAFFAAGRVSVPSTFGFRLAGDSRTRRVTTRNWGSDMLRIGDTIEPDPGQEQWRVLRTLAGPELRQVYGLRPVLETLLVDLWAPRLVIATGGRRTGLSTAGGIALRVAEIVGG